MAEQLELIPDDVKKVIKETFLDQLKQDVAVEVYTLAGINDKFNDAAVSLVMSLAGLSDKLKVSFHTVGDAQSQKRNVTRTPTVLIAPDKYRIRYSGAPLGEEGKSLLVALMMAASGATVLSEPSARKLAELRDKRDIQVFISPTCPSVQNMCRNQKTLEIGEKKHETQNIRFFSTDDWNAHPGSLRPSSHPHA